MRRAAWLVLSWVSVGMVVLGLGTAMVLTVYAGWFGDLETGAPFNPLAGLIYLAWLFKHPLVLVAWLVGIFGFAAGGVSAKRLKQ